MKVNHLTLAFCGPQEELEKPFQDAYFKKYLPQSKILHLITILFYGSSSILDVLLFPEIKHTLLAIRFVTCAPFFIGFIFCYTSIFAKIWQALFAFYIIMTGVSFIMIMNIAPEPMNYSYAVGVIVCMIFGYILIRARFITALLSCWFLFLFYEIVAILVVDTPTMILIATTYYLAIVTVLGMIISRTLEYNERKGFYQSYILEMVNRDLEEKIEARQQAENKLTAVLKQKEIYLKEIHHRVKNNLQVISSLLDMTCNRSESPLVRKTLLGARSKIQAMSFVHHQLYQNKDVHKIDMGKQVHDLYQNLSMVYGPGVFGADCRITTDIKVDGVYLPLDKAMPSALVINELISNALEHAFAEQSKGRLEILMHQTDQSVRLEVNDDGVGLPLDLDMETVDSLGLRLVQILVTKQLKGRVEIDRTNGTGFALHFDNSCDEDNVIV